MIEFLTAKKKSFQLKFSTEYRLLMVMIGLMWAQCIAGLNIRKRSGKSLFVWSRIKRMTVTNKFDMRKVNERIKDTQQITQGTFLSSLAFYRNMWVTLFTFFNIRRLCKMDPSHAVSSTRETRARNQLTIDLISSATCIEIRRVTVSCKFWLCCTTSHFLMVQWIRKASV